MLSGRYCYLSVENVKALFCEDTLIWIACLDMAKVQGELVKLIEAHNLFVLSTFELADDNHLLLFALKNGIRYSIDTVPAQSNMTLHLSEVG